MISLYECFEARIKDKYVYCAKGHRLGKWHIHIRQVARGDKLVCKACQNCSDVDYEPMQYPNERGWLELPVFDIKRD